MSNLWMQTHSGVPLDIKAPDPKRIVIPDFVRSICGQPRYLNHTRRDPYFVGEHCIRVSYLLAQWGHDATMQLRGLLHDLPEAVLGDITAPVKAAIREHTCALDVIEDRWLYAVLDCFGLPHMRSDPPMDLKLWEATQAIIKRADLVMLATERRDHMAECERDWRLPHLPLPAKLGPPLTSDAAERAYMDRLEELQAARAA